MSTSKSSPIIHSAQETIFVSRIDLLEYAKSKEVTPLCENFRQICHEWLLQKFDLTENTLIDGKTIEKWLDYITEETLKRWRAAKRVWKPLFGPTKLGNFFKIEIKISHVKSLAATSTNELETKLDGNLDTEMAMDVDEAPIVEAPVVCMYVYVQENYKDM